MTAVSIRDHHISTPHGTLFARRWTPDHTSQVQLAPIVLFHDSLGCVEFWRDFPARLAETTGREVIAYDRMGFGRSSTHPGGWSTRFIQEEAELYFPLLRQRLGIDHFIPYGYSVGGAMAASCASQLPEACIAVITQSAQGFVDEQVKSGIRDAQQNFAAPGQVERLAKYHGEKAQWVLSAWIDTWLSEDFAAWRIEQTAPDLHCPLLVMHGDHDEYGSLAHPNHIVMCTRGKSDLVIIEDCHHTPHREHPEKVLAAVSRFVRVLQ